jgi:hypothetical protein
MSRTKLEAARELINELRYAEARAILRTMPDNPTAQNWLAKLDRIDPEKPPAAAEPPPEAAPPSIYQYDPERPPSAPAPYRPAHANYTPPPESAPAEASPALRRARRRVLWLRIQALIFGVLRVAVILWLLYGLLGTASQQGLVGAQITGALTGLVDSVLAAIGQPTAAGPGVEGAARDVGSTAGRVLTISFFFCTALPLFFVTGSLYRRTATVLRDERQHKEVLESMERRST